MKDTTAAVVAKYLEQEGVEYFFGVPGGHVLPLYDGLYRATSVKPILTKHEGGGAFLAYGYAAATGRLGVCCGTVGPGATNAVTGVAAAHMDSVPLLVLTGQVGTKAFGRSAHQEATGYGRSVDQVALFKNITKMSVMVTHADGVSRTLRTALRVAQSGRPGPVHVALPSNIQLEKVEEEILPVAAYRPLDTASVPEAGTIKAVGDLLREASNPALLVGYGASRLAADDALVRFVERLQLPVATSGKAKGVFPEDHPLSLGCLGLRGAKAANTYLRSGIDVLLVLGTDLSEMTSHAWDPKLIPSTALIQVDIDANEIGKNYPVTIGVVADAVATLRALDAYLRDFPASPERDLSAFKDEKQYFDEDESRSDAVPLKPQRLMRELRAGLPRDTLVLGDMGNCYSWILRYFQAYPEGMTFLPSGLACMGSAVAASIGAKLGKPDAPVVCICGDGDFFMTGMELLTAVEYGVPVVWVVLKNNRLGLIHDVQALSYKGRFAASAFGGADFVAIAEAFGAAGRRIERPEDVAPAVAAALESGGPTVLEAVIDPDEKFPLTSRGTAVKDSVGLPAMIDSISAESVKALFKMFRNREV